MSATPSRFARGIADKSQAQREALCGGPSTSWRSTVINQQANLATPLRMTRVGMPKTNPQLNYYC
jgi:hypothetical protein